ncbi:MAG: gamma-glutamyltransferase [Planctomycetota bacterium]|nr:MAG: gamma-glutamyltransferase [Planctomycetota bacterium]
MPGPAATHSGAHAIADAGRGLVAAGFPDAARLGAEALRRGGNAADAACAAAWALAVCEPAESGLGGQAFAVVAWPDGRAEVVDGSSRAPRRAARSSVSREQQSAGRRASTVPSAPAALDDLQRRFGRFDPADALGAAAELADAGHRLTPLQSRQVRWTADALSADPLARRLFFGDDGSPKAPGARIRQPELARTLRRLADAGVDDFYRGETARAIAEDQARAGGLIDARDLAAVAGPAHPPPLEIEWAGRRVVSAPPPSGGATTLLALLLLERFEARTDAPSLTDRAIAIARAGRAALRERDRWPDHPDDLTESIRRWLVSRERADAVFTRSVADDAPGADARSETGDTTHLCAADGEGMTVSMTLSIQSVFGAKVMCQPAGFFYNNSLTTCPRSPHPYRLAVGAAPRSNASPLVLLAERPGGWTPEFALGAAGSRRMIAALLRTLEAACVHGDSLPEAIRAPRIHAPVSRGVWVERPLLRRIDRDRLTRACGPITVLPRLAYKAGAVHAVRRLPDGRVAGAADPRRDGAVVAE